MRSMLRRLALTPMLLLATGCVSSPPIIASRTACSTLVPKAWRAGVGVPKLAPVAPDASDLDRLKSWQQFGLEAASRIMTGDSRTADSIGITERCEARDLEAVRKSRPKFLGIF